MHRGTPERLAAYARLWAEQGVVAWETWAPEVRRVADVVGSLVGAPPGTTVMRQNVADLLGDVISCLDWRGARNRVVTSSLEWPGSLNTWSQLDRLGGEAVVVPGRPDGVDARPRRDGRRDRRAHRCSCECSHVLFRTSTLVDVAPARRPRPRGRRAGHRRRLPGRRHRAGRRRRARRRPLRRRVGEVPVRRSRQRLAVRRAARQRGPAAGDHRLVRHRPPVRLRPASSTLRARASAGSRAAPRASRPRTPPPPRTRRWPRSACSGSASARCR